MQNSLMSYREESPGAKAAHCVLSFWEFRVDETVDAPLEHEVFPDGCLSIVYARNSLIENERMFVSGINPKSIFVPVKAGDVFWGMRIAPESGFAFFGTNPVEIHYLPFQSETLGKRFAPDLQNALADCADFSEAVAVYENYIESFGVGSAEIDGRLAKATRIFIKSEGLAKVSETAREIGLSERQFERSFQKATGLSPKQFARICRFRATAIDLVKNAAQNWAARAADKGFTDQSHLNREFSSLSGNSPLAFEQKTRRIRHGKILK